MIKKTGILLLSISLRDFLPIYYFPKVLHIFCSCIAVVDIVRMFPYITIQKRSIFSSERSRCIHRIYNIETSVCLSDEPCPSRAEVRKCHTSEFSSKCIERSPSCIYRIIELFRWNMIGDWAQCLKIKYMIVDLRCIIEYSSSWSFSNNILEWERRIFCLWCELVQIIDICLEMLPMMIFECLPGNMRSKCIERIWKWCEWEHILK